MFYFCSGRCIARSFGFVAVSFFATVDFFVATVSNLLFNSDKSSFCNFLIDAYHQFHDYLRDLLCYLLYRWNKLDLVIVALSILGITLEEADTNFLPINPTIIRVMRVFRIARGIVYYSTPH